jgi:hypothetical protein
MALVGCGPFRLDNPMETSVPSSKFGIRLVDGDLKIWTGSPCEGVTEINLIFTAPPDDRTELQLYTPTAGRGFTPGVEVEYVSLGGPHPGLQVSKALPPDFDWRAANRLSIHVGGPPVARGADIDFPPIVAEITEHSSEHSEDTFFFPGLGWLDPAEVAAGDGREFLTLCTPDPAKQESKERVVGVRVTDDSLRFWTGTPCPFNAGVILTFQPGQAELILQKDAPREDVEYLTLGDPGPEFVVTHPLPDTFDWRTAKSVLLRLIDDESLRWSRTTQLATPIAESSRHPPDTYYFEGVGWLDPAEVAARDGDSLRTICNNKR